MNNFFVIGTDTDVGKTYFSALLVKTLGCGYYKAALSGTYPDENGKMIPGDVKEVCDMAGLGNDYDRFVSYAYKKAYSPHLAARFEDMEPMDANKIISDYEALEKEFGQMVWEGAGGIICPLRYDQEAQIFLLDLVKAFCQRSDQNKVLLVSKSGLGAINSTVLTCSYLKAQGVETAGIVMNGFEEDNVCHQDNKIMIERITGVPVVETISLNQLSLSATKNTWNSL